MNASRVAATLAVVVACSAPPKSRWAAAQTAAPTEHLAQSLDGRPLNFDFERGDLSDWTADGEAFAGQPIWGDTVHARRGDSISGHLGDRWIGTYEVAGDAPQGTLTSVPFEVAHPFVSFYVGGGASPDTRVELVHQGSGEVLLTASGHDAERMRPVAFDVAEHLGEVVFLRLVDASSGPWGHINFDHFRFHDAKPQISSLEARILTPDEYPHAGLDAEQAVAAMTLPEGFSATVFAAEPAIAQPIAMALDDRGRLWVAEAYEYPRRAPQGQGRDRILIFADSDGDGRFDQRKVFAEGLNLVSGLEVGFGGVWVGAAPYLLFLPDRDGDDVPDGEPEILLDGWGYQDTHETLNAFIWGPDGWLYGCHGVFTHSIVGKPGTPHSERTPLNAAIWRYHPVRHTFEVFAHGTSNPWGVDFTDRGEAVCTACVIPHLFHMIKGGRYHRQAGSHFNPYTYDDIKTIADHRHYLGDTPHGGNDKSDDAGGGHAHAGAMIYLGGAWPDEHRGRIFMNN
ncbi:MAG TPA: dehydrogenase, partial [Lacipirellulaceae bacterium]|nr:dehydrogenase [Lacipirellulaceae bacterium]